MTTTEVTDATFDTIVTQATTPVLVDLWAPWCGPCKQMAPLLDELSGTYEGKVTIVKLDIDANPATAAALGIISIPTLLLYRDGQQTKTLTGAQSRRALTSAIETLIA